MKQTLMIYKREYRINSKTDAAEVLDRLISTEGALTVPMGVRSFCMYQFATPDKQTVVVKEKLAPTEMKETILSFRQAVNHLWGNRKWFNHKSADNRKLQEGNNGSSKHTYLKVISDSH